MNGAQIRKIVREEIQRANGSARFRVNSIPEHTHDGVNSPRIREESLIPNASIVGSVTFATVQTYTIQLNASFTPKQMQVYGIMVGVEGTNDPVRGIIVGSAQFTPTFYLQDPTSADTPDNYVITGDLQFPFNGVTGGITPGKSGVPAQTCAWFKAASITGSDDYRAAVSEDHIASVTYGNIIRARVSVVDFSKNAITLKCSHMEPNWYLILNFVIS
jgi:hypothetical protein